MKAKALKVLELSKAVLEKLPKGAVEKQVLAWFLRGRTTVSNEWLSRHLHCGHPGNIPRYIKAVEMSKDKTVVSLRNDLLKCED